MMEHVARDGSAKILDDCTLPYTGRNAVNRIITDLAVIDVLPDRAGLLLHEIAFGVDLKTVRAATGTNLEVASHPREIRTYLDSSSRY